MPKFFANIARKRDARPRTLLNDARSGDDFGVIELNEEALLELKGPKAIEIVPGATHLFPEPGALEAVINHAARWFDAYLMKDKMKIRSPQ